MSKDANHLTVDRLRAAGMDDEARRLEDRVRQSTLWSGRAIAEHVVALSYFGSAEYDRLLTHSEQ
jgi:hypothetical protein